MNRRAHLCALAGACVLTTLATGCVHKETKEVVREEPRPTTVIHEREVERERPVAREHDETYIEKRHEYHEP